MLGWIPIWRRGADCPEFRRRLRELNSHRGETGVRRTEECDCSFPLIPAFQVFQKNFLPQGHFRSQDNECPVGAHRDRERLFLKCAVVLSFASNHEGHVQNYALTSPGLGIDHGKLRIPLKATSLTIALKAAVSMAPTAQWSVKVTGAFRFALMQTS